MRQQGLTLYGSPKAILFSYSPMEQDEIIHCLACEMLPMGNLMGEELVRWSQENFAQYDIARVYASDRCLLEISQMKGEILTERLNLEAVELFFLELLMMQEAAIARVSDRTYDLFREGLYREDSSGSQEKLFSLSQEAASAVLFVNFKKLRFPTVRISFKKIAERFGIAEGLENYQTCREMLEQMIAINTAEAEKADGDLMNLLLLFLTMMQEMLADGRRVGLDFWVCSAYRTIEKQTALFEDKVRRVTAELGLTGEAAREKAGTEVAFPGTSEHNLGLAVDIVARDYQILDEKQAQTAEAQWLKENCWKYGFILRYPTDKTEETGIIFEPWHYRYVGEKAAKEIMDQGICLEEYLDAVQGG